MSLNGKQALAMRAAIGQAGLNFRDVYQAVGITRETDTTDEQLAEVYRAITAAERVQRQVEWLPLDPPVRLCRSGDAIVFNADGTHRVVRARWWRRLVRRAALKLARL